MNAAVQEDTTMQPINLFDYEELARQRMAISPGPGTTIRVAVRMK